MRRWLAPAALLMVLAIRLIPTSGGTGAFAPPATIPPFDASWVRSGSSPVLAASLAWEQTAVSEVAAVLYTGTTWKMWYSGGWANPGIGHATSSDGLTWTKSGSNPVLGQGGSGLAGPVASARVFLNGTTYHLYGSSGSPLRSTMIHYTSTDGIAWSSAALTISFPTNCDLWGNREVWLEGSTWKMLQEAQAVTDGLWRIYLYTSPDGATWSIANGGAALGTLQATVGDNYGGPRFASAWTGPTPRFGGVYHLWYHDGAGANTNIFTATSSDLITWTIGNGGSPVLTRTGSGFEVDQVAGPTVTVVNGTAYLFYDGDDNATGIAKIGVATAPATY